MARETHPLSKHLKATGESLTAFAARMEMSRMQLYRIMDGESTSIGTLQKLSKATEIHEIDLINAIKKQPEAAR